jgi:hypothetical protein
MPKRRRATEMPPKYRRKPVPPPTPEELTAAIRSRATARQLQLLRCAIIRHTPFTDEGQTIWELLPQNDWFSAYKPNSAERISYHQVIELVERIADGGAAEDDLRVAEFCCGYASWAAEADCFHPAPERRAEVEFRYGVACEIARLMPFPGRRDGEYVDCLTDYSGELIGWTLRFRLPRAHRDVVHYLIHDVFGDLFHPVSGGPWITPAAVSVARDCYDRRDFSALPLLADLLEEAGCPEQSVLDHLRSPGPHVRGCWAVDLVLGKG